MGWSNNFPLLYARQNERKLARILLAVEAYTFDQVYSHSPVESGRYRANHNRTAEKPDFRFDWGKESGKAPPPRIRGPFTSLYIANGAPYGRRIEFHGWSHKASGGVYQVAANSAKVRF